MIDEISKIEKGEFVGVVRVEMTPSDPREFNENLGKMVCFHKSYELGDKTDLRTDDFEGWDTLEGYLITKEGASVILPLFMLDHSGITISTKSFHDHFDSGQIGFIYATHEDICKEYGESTPIDEAVEKVKEVLLAEVQEYDKYVSGEVYCATMYEKKVCNLGHEHFDIMDITCGFYEVSEAEDYINEYLGGVK